MIPTEDLTDVEFERVALELLNRELGVDGLARFLRLNQSGRGDYTTDRVAWQRGLSVDDIADSILRRRPTSSEKQ